MMWRVFLNGGMASHGWRNNMTDIDTANQTATLVVRDTDEYIAAMKLMDQIPQPWTEEDVASLIRSFGIWRAENRSPCNGKYQSTA